MESPNLLSRLFMANVCGGLLTRPVLRALAAPVLGAMLTLRFRFHRNRKDRVFEALEEQLLPIARQLEQDGFLVGNRFAAADLTLASLLRPLRIVPYFSHHPHLQSMFAWQERLFRAHGRDVEVPYEETIRMQRERRGRMRGRVSWMSPVAAVAAEAGVHLSFKIAHNDIHSVNRWMLIAGLPAYLKLRWFSGVGRMRYVPISFG